MSDSQTANSSPMIVVLTTGGTIASSTDADGVVRNDTALGAPQLPEHLSSQLPDELRIEAREVLSKDSSQMTDDDRLLVCRAIAAALEDPQVTAVVVTHGTDSLADMAMAADLYHRDPRPVIITGAQRPADDPAPDGPANLFDAYQVALSESARGIGALVVFGRAIMQARGVAKWHTSDELGFARNAPEESESATKRPLTLALPDEGTAWPRVECVWAGTGASATALSALISDGISAYVLVAMGMGNLPSKVAAVAKEHAEIPCVLTSSVPRGAVHPVYGGPGGGAELVDAGAIAGGWLRAGQARIALAALLADDPSATPATLAPRFAELM